MFRYIKAYRHRPSKTRRRLLLALLSATSGMTSCVHNDLADNIAIDFIGQQVFPTGYLFQGLEIGGLSGIDYNPVSDTYVAISDDRGQLGPVRFHRLRIDLSDQRLNADDITFLETVEIFDRTGKSFPSQSTDPESIRYAPDLQSLLWTSEGDRQSPPFVRVMTTAGFPVAEFNLPDYFQPTTAAGPRLNKGFESLAFSADKQHVVAAMENAMQQDGPAAAVGIASPVRVLSFSYPGGELQAEHIYKTEPVAEAPEPKDAFSTNGLVELLAIDERRWLALERSFSVGAGNRIRLFLTSFNGATDIHGQRAVAGATYQSMPKRLLLDFDELGLALDNIEGMTLGPVLANGARSLILVSDNNFNRAGNQFTQFLAFRLQ